MTDAERIAALEAEVAHWKRVALDPEVMLQPTADGVSLAFRHVVVSCVADALDDLLSDAPNYVSVEAHSKRHGALVVTVRRANGFSPEDLAAEYRGRLKAMGVTDLAPLPERPTEYQPDPVHEPHMWINARVPRFECRSCGAHVPFELPARGERFGALLNAFCDLHRGCARKGDGDEQ